MRKIFFAVVVALSCLVTTSCSGQKSDGGVEVLLETTAGDIRIRLYDDTPRHRDNFIKNVKEGKYDGVTFHRVIRNFMIQTGDPDTRPGEVKDTTVAPMRIEQEVKFPLHFHKRGVIASAKDEEDKNPKGEDDMFQFYIVTGKYPSTEDFGGYEKARSEKIAQKIYEKKLDANKARIDELRAKRDRDRLSDVLEKLKDESRMEADELNTFEYPAEVKKTYQRYGGAPWLDGEYTVFGEVIEGMKIVLTIEKSKTNDADVPVRPIVVTKASIVE